VKCRCSSVELLDGGFPYLIKLNDISDNIINIISCKEQRKKLHKSEQSIRNNQSNFLHLYSLNFCKNLTRIRRKKEISLPQICLGSREIDILHLPDDPPAN
jgi:hypothetical protein